MNKNLISSILLIVVLSMAVIGFIALVASSYVAKTNEKYSKKINRITAYIVLSLGCACALILIICICIPKLNLSILERVSMLFAALVVGSISIMCLLIVKNFKIDVLEEGILYHNIFNKTKKIDYKDIELKFNNNVVNIVWVREKNNKTKLQTLRGISKTEADYELLLKYYNENKEVNTELD